MALAAIGSDVVDLISTLVPVLAFIGGGITAQWRRASAVNQAQALLDVASVYDEAGLPDRSPDFRQSAQRALVRQDVIDGRRRATKRKVMTWWDFGVGMSGVVMITSWFLLTRPDLDTSQLWTLLGVVCVAGAVAFCCATREQNAVSLAVARKLSDLPPIGKLQGNRDRGWPRIGVNLCSAARRAISAGRPRA